jgi:hypothetical protein
MAERVGFAANAENIVAINYLKELLSSPFDLCFVAMTSQRLARPWQSKSSYPKTRVAFSGKTKTSDILKRMISQ